MYGATPVVFRNRKRVTRATKGNCPVCHGTMHRIEK